MCTIRLGVRPNPFRDPSVSSSILFLLLDSESSCSQGQDRVLAAAIDLRVDGLGVETDIKSPFSSYVDMTKEL